MKNFKEFFIEVLALPLSFLIITLGGLFTAIYFYLRH